jgi:hypothetical protein
MLARFVGGWGILGGLKLGAPPGAQAESLLGAYFAQTVSPNPQIMVGTIAQISPGAGIDAAGRTLTLCEPRTVDLTALISQPSAPTTQPCNVWFQGLPVPQCNPANYAEDGANPNQAYPPLTATAYWLVAQFIETPARPAPQYTGGGPCDPAPTCNYSRRLEGIQLSLVPALPTWYFLTGCLDPFTFTLPEGINFPIPFNLSGTGASGFALSAGMSTAAFRAGQPSSVAAGVSNCLYLDYAIVDWINAQLAAACCCTPALVLGQIIFTSNPGNLQGNLPNAPMYTILLDAFPFRRVIASAALELYAILANGCSQSNNAATTALPGATATPAPAPAANVPAQPAAAPPGRTTKG